MKYPHSQDKNEVFRILHGYLIVAKRHHSFQLSIFNSQLKRSDKFQFIALLNITDCLSGQSYPICIPDKIQYPDFRCCILFSGDGMRYEVLKFENIRNLRIDNGYTQKQITAYLGISQNTYSQYELGVIHYPVEVLTKLADFYGLKK